MTFLSSNYWSNGKTLLADILASRVDCEVYRPDCTKESESAMYIDMIKQNIDIPSMFVGQYIYILDEADKLSPNNIAKLKTTIDAIDRRRQKNLPVYVKLKRAFLNDLLPLVK